MKGWGSVFFSLSVLFNMLGLPEQAQAGRDVELSQVYNKSDQKSGYPAVKPNRQLDISCFVSAIQAYPKFKSGWTMVDLRSEPAFEKFRVPGSIQIAEHALASRAFLKKRRLILINDGFNIDRMVSLCGELKRAGFSSVVALFGGVAQWHQSGFPVEGTPPRYSQLLSISPDHFFQMKNSGFLQVMHVSAKDTIEQRSLFPESVSTGGWRNVGRELDRVAARYKGMLKPIAMMLVDQDGKSYEKNIGVVNGREYPVFFLAGGINAYRHYLGKQQAMREHLLHPPQRRTFCGY